MVTDDVTVFYSDVGESSASMNSGRPPDTAAIAEKDNHRVIVVVIYFASIIQINWPDCGKMWTRGALAHCVWLTAV